MEKTTISNGYTINGQFFKTKDAIHQKMREILYAYPIGAKINSDDSAFLLELLHNHPNATKKIGCGIEAFEVRQESSISRCFYLIRMDGSTEHFSHRKCLRTPTSYETFNSICRNLVSRQMYQLKSAHFREYAREDGYVQCTITGNWVARDDTHVDHAPPDTFESLVHGFIQTNNINVEKVEIQDSEGVFINKTFADASLVEKWVTYHDEHANLRVISSFANMDMARRKKEALNRLAQHYDLSLVYELEPHRTEFLVDLALECSYKEWHGQDFELLKTYASRLVGAHAAQPLLRPTKYEEYLNAFIDCLLQEVKLP